MVHNNLKQSLIGAGTGFLAGLLIGICEAEWLRLFIFLGLIAFSGKVMQGKNLTSASKSYKYAFNGIAASFAMLIGLYINGQQFFKESPKAAIASLVEKGYSPDHARELYIKQIQTQFKNKRTISNTESENEEKPVNKILGL